MGSSARSLQRLCALTLASTLLVVVLPQFARGEDPPEFSWIRQFGSPAYDTVWGMTSDGSGIYVVGSTHGALPGQNHAGGPDGFVRKYDFNGGEVWTRQIGTPGDDGAWSVAAGGGAVYVSGFAGGPLPGQTSSGGSDAYLRKYAPDGAEVWTAQFGTAANDYGYGVALHGSGVYVTGVTNGAFPGESNLGGWDSFLRKYDFGGNPVWTRQSGASTDDAMEAAVVDDTGVYVTGWVYGAMPGQTGAGDYDPYVRKYDLAGVEQWTDQFGSIFADHPDGGIVADSTGVYVSGWAARALTGQTSVGEMDAFLRKYDRSGTVLWTRQFGTTRIDSAYGSYADESGVYVTGNTYSAFPGYANAGVYGDVFVRKYDSAGTEAWTRQFGSTDDDLGKAVVPAAGFLFLSGFVSAALPTQSQVGVEDAFAVRLGGTPGADASPGTLSFGEVELGAMPVDTVTVTSVGTAFLTVTGISLASGLAGFGLDSGPLPPFFLPPQESVDIRISFGPYVRGFATDTLRIETNDPARGTIDVPLSGTGITVPRIDVTPPASTFGSVEKGLSTTRNVTIHSQGSGSLTVTTISLLVGTSGYAIDAPPSTPFDIPSGGTASVRIRFAPDAVGHRSDTLRIASNAADRPTVDIPLSGDGFVVPDLAIAPASLAFESVEIGTVASETLTISSVRSGDVTVTEISLASGTQGFEILAAPATPFVLRPGTFAEVEVTFAPSATGPAGDAIAIQSDDPSEGSIVVPLQAVGVDTTPPEILHVRPGDVPVGEPIPIRATVTDLGGVASVTLYYRGFRDASFRMLTMDPVGGEHVGVIPSQPGASDVSYHIVARDAAGNEAREPGEGVHVVRVTAEPPTRAGDLLSDPVVLISLMAVVVAIVLAAVFVVRRRRSPKSP